MKITHVSKEQWQEYFSANAHLSVFGEKYDPSQERISFALLAADDHNTLILYCTFTELDKDKVYMNFGGSFPPYRNSSESFRAFQQFISWLSQKYQDVFYHTENTNFSMLKFGIKIEAKIIGLSYSKKGKVLIEHQLELNRASS